MIKHAKYSKKEGEEIDRLLELDSYAILDTAPEVDFDKIADLAAEICETPIALISFVDEKRQWFKAHHGLKTTETAREHSFCAHAIKDPKQVLIIKDARKDDRFKDNSLVTGEPHVVFYAGVPLISENNFPLGTLCVIDHQPKTLTETQLKALSALSVSVTNLLKLRKNKILLTEALDDALEKKDELEQFAFIAAHDLKSPLKNIASITQLFSDENNAKLNEEGKEMLNLIHLSSEKLSQLIDGILEYSRSENVLKEEKSKINLEDLKKDILVMLGFNHHLEIELKTDLKEIQINKIAIEQILINLIANAVKYSDKDIVKIEMDIYDPPTYYEFYLKDNGPGIAKENLGKIFDLYENIGAKDKFGEKGTGIGLATVKKLVERLGGEISVESEIGKGTKFKFTIEK